MQLTMRHSIYSAPAFMFLILLSWAVASPIGSSPDDDFHLPSAWCARGELSSLCKLTEDKQHAMVPPIIAFASTCYKFKPGMSGACQNDLIQSESAFDGVTNRFNQGLYPKLYFSTMYYLAEPDFVSSILSMRMLNVLIFCTLLTAIFILSSAELRVNLVWNWLVCSVPLSIFFIASNNPTSWTIIGIGCLFVSILGYLQSFRWQKFGLALTTMVSSLLAMGSRADGAIYVILVIITVNIITLKRIPSFVDKDVWFQLVISATAFLFFFSSTQGQIVAVSGMDVVGMSHDVASVFWHNLSSIPDLWVGAMGYARLGWLDTPMSLTVLVGTQTALFAMIYHNADCMWQRKKVAALFVLFMIVFIPMWVLMKGMLLLPFYVQPRYILPLIYLLVAVILLRDGTKPVPISRFTTLTVTCALGLAHSLALHISIRRYVTGLDVVDWNLDRKMEWWEWDMVSPMTVWIIASLSGFWLVFTLMHYLYTQSKFWGRGKVPE